MDIAHDAVNLGDQRIQIGREAGEIRIGEAVHKHLDSGWPGGNLDINLFLLVIDRRWRIIQYLDVDIENAGDKAFGFQGGAQTLAHVVAEVLKALEKSVA